MSEESTDEVNKIQHQKKNAMIGALKSTLGIVSLAADQVGIDRSTHYSWINTDPVYKQAVDDLKERQRDFGESALLAKIREGDTAAIIYYNKTQNRGRGYGEHDYSAGEGVPEWVIKRVGRKE